MKQGPGNLSDFLRDRGYQGRGGTIAGAFPFPGGSTLYQLIFIGKVIRKEPTMAKQQEVRFKVGRDARDGRFETVQRAKNDPSHHVVETIKRQVSSPSPSKKK
jgi:hypothetical protein